MDVGRLCHNVGSQRRDDPRLFRLRVVVSPFVTHIIAWKQCLLFIVTEIMYVRSWAHTFKLITMLSVRLVSTNESELLSVYTMHFELT